MILPTLEKLAELAATMATVGEEPEATAARALVLWRACEIALRDADFFETQRREQSSAHFNAIIEFESFLGECLGRDMSHAVPDENENAPLLAVLKALMPKKDAADSMAKWRKFRGLAVMNDDEDHGRPPKNEAELLDAVAAVIRKDCEFGISTKYLRDVRHCFVNFEELDRKELRSQRGIQAALAKKEKANARKKALGDRKADGKSP